MTDGFRESVWRRCGARAEHLPELLAYAENTFDWTGLQASSELPWADAPGVETWARYVERADAEGAVPVLREALAQLRFPIAAGISESDEYREATRLGQPRGSCEGVGWTLEDPEAVQLFLQPTPAGRVPVIVAGTRGDFVALVQALTRRNEPASIPDAMGACIVSGYNNWDRVRELYGWWDGGGSDEPARWRTFLNAIAPRRELYQDRFILLSRGPYSAVSAEELGLQTTEWLHVSLAIRLEHECTHYVTQQMFGSMRNALLDELLADFMGITAASGAYRADWFLRFTGLEGPRGAASGRLTLYRGQPPLSEYSFGVLQVATRFAAAALQEFSIRRGGRWPTMSEQIRQAAAIGGVGLEGLASDDAAARLEQAYSESERLP